MIRIPAAYAVFDRAMAAFPVTGVKPLELAVVLGSRFYNWPAITTGGLPAGKTADVMQAELDALYRKDAAQLGVDNGRCLLIFSNAWRDIPTEQKNAWRYAWGIQKGSPCYATFAELDDATFQSTARTQCSHCQVKTWPNGAQTRYCDYAPPKKQPQDGYRAEQNAPKLFKEHNSQYYILDLDKHPDTLKQVLRGARLPLYPTMAAMYFGSTPLMGGKQGQTVAISDLASDFRLSPEQIDIIFDADPDLPANKAVLDMTEAALVNKLTEDIYVKHQPMRFSPELLARYYLSLKTKPFVLLTGISGTGKTQIARRVAERLCGKVAPGARPRVEVVAVRPDWVDNTGLMGSYNPLLQRFRRTGALAVALNAFIDLVNSPTTASPHFLILDEMNLSRVEYYFADFLSSMEARDPELFFGNMPTQPEVAVSNQPTFELHQEQRCVAVNMNDPDTAINGVPTGICQSDCAACPLRHLLSPDARAKATLQPHTHPQDFVPPRLFVPFNLYVTGTVNVDETTHPFSAKVLDRANVIEFNDVTLDLPTAPLVNAGGGLTDADLDLLSELFSGQPGGRHSWTNDIAFSAPVRDYVAELKTVNAVLEPRNLHFGYRVRNEMLRFLHHVETTSLFPPAGPAPLPMEDAFDIQLLQKVLPKLNGSEGKLEAVLAGLYDLCWEGTPAKRLSDYYDAAEVEQLLSDLKQQVAAREILAPLGAWTLQPNQTPPAAPAAAAAAPAPAPAALAAAAAAAAVAAPAALAPAAPAPAAPAPAPTSRLRYPRAARKVASMWRRMQEDGFTGFFE